MEQGQNATLHGKITGRYVQKPDKILIGPNMIIPVLCFHNGIISPEEQPLTLGDGRQKVKILMQGFVTPTLGFKCMSLASVIRDKISPSIAAKIILAFGVILIEGQADLYLFWISSTFQ